MTRTGLAALAAGFLILPAPSPAQVAVGAPAPMSPGEGYRLGVNDEVEVTIFGRENQVVKTRVKEDGTIVVPLIGTVRARDRTARELAADIASQLRSGGYLVNPVVNVDVSQFVSNSVTVLGSVGTPGIYPLDRPQTVAMALARAGGGRPEGADYVVLRRAGETAEHQIRFDSFEGEWSGATPLLPGDTLFVPEAPVFYVYGQVNTPGSFAIRSGMTVRQALARAGGPTLAGTTRKVTIYRGNTKLRKADLDSLVQPGDTLKVGERLF